MPMTLAELLEHTENVRTLLADKRRRLPDLDPITRAAVIYQIKALEPRVRELEAQCLKLSERSLLAYGF